MLVCDPVANNKFYLRFFGGSFLFPSRVSKGTGRNVLFITSCCLSRPEIGLHICKPKSGRDSLKIHLRDSSPEKT